MDAKRSSTSTNNAESLSLKDTSQDRKDQGTVKEKMKIVNDDERHSCTMEPKQNGLVAKGKSKSERKAFVEGLANEFDAFNIYDSKMIEEFKVNSFDVRKHLFQTPSRWDPDTPSKDKPPQLPQSH